jgi:type II secretory pathway pseudopilin PulG
MRLLGVRSPKYKPADKSQNGQRGYLMITLMLMFALIAIALLAVLPDMKQQIVRDREDEMRHRGTAYMRAIQHFYKKFGRYPTKVEELESTNNLRFLRKRYKDPMNRDRTTGKEKDFKFLTQMDITLNNGPLLGAVPGQGGAGGIPGQIPGQGGFQGAGGFGGAQGGFGAQGGLGAGGSQPGGLGQNSNSNSQAGANGDSGSSSSSNGSGGSSDADGNSNQNQGGSSSSSNSGTGPNGQQFGGGPILGVASLSKEKSIRVFYDKNHYNDWLFVYLPQADRGGLLTGPVSQNGTSAGGFGSGIPGQGGTLPGQAGGVPGQGFGQGLGQGASPFGGQGSSTPTPPSQGPTSPE